MFWRKKKKEEKKEKDVVLRYPDLQTFESWVRVMIKGLNLQEGRFTFIAAYGGVILFIKGEGLAWMPYKQIQEVMKKVDSKELLKNSVFLGSVVAASVAHVALLPIFVIDRSLSGLYRIYSDEPPNKVQMYLHSLIDRVEIKRIKLKMLSKLNQNLPLKERKGNEVLELSIRLKYFDDIDLNTLEKFSDSLKKLMVGSYEPRFTLPLTTDILILTDALEEDGAKIEYIDITREEIASAQNYHIEDESAVADDEVDL